MKTIKSPQSHFQFNAAMPSILTIGLSADDADRIQAIADRLGKAIRHVATYRQGVIRLGREKVGIVFCAGKLADGDWQDVLSITAPQTNRPRLIVIVARIDEPLRTEVRNMGGFGALASPVLERDALRCIESASLTWWDEVSKESWMRPASP